MKVSLYFIISLLLFSCSNYSINYETEIDTKRIFSDGYNTDESLSEHGSFKYGNVLLENTSKDEKLEYTIEKKEIIIKEAYIEYSRPFFVAKFNSDFYDKIKSYSKTVNSSYLFYKELRPGELKNIGVINRIEISAGLYKNNNPMGDRNDPRYSSYEYINNSVKGNESHQISQANPNKKYYKKVKLISYEYNIKGWQKK